MGVRQFREELKAWLDRAQAGEEITITERGRPVARLIPAGVARSLDRLIAEGRVTPARRPRPRIRLEDLITPSGGPVSDFLKE